METITKQFRFTVVEIAIVLGVAGMLMVGALKGPDLIDNARVKSTINEMDGIVAAYTGYKERYRTQPGDDGPTDTLVARGGSFADMIGNAAPNGLIAEAVVAAATFAPAAGAENELFFRHLRAGGYLTGDPAALLNDALPNSAWGGKIGILNVASIQGRPAVARLMLCLGSVPGKAAAALDRQLDDGIPGSGAFRATVGNTNVVPAAVALAVLYDELLFYTVCRDFP